ncbi:MAG: hypothetical protein AB4057_10655 [Crocosphaera sp.]
MRINSLQLFNRRRRRQTTEYLSNEDYSWIWEPFKDAKDSKLAQTACLAAEIIANSSSDKMPKVPFNLDPRIVIPLCLIELQKDLNNLDKINQVNIQENYPRADVINYFLNKTQPSPRWLYLFDSLSSQLKYKLCYRIINYRLPDKNDWHNLFKHNNYEFNKSWHYYFILVILLVISFVAIIGMFFCIEITINIFLRIFVMLNLIILIAVWFYWRKHDFKFTSLKHINCNDEFISFIHYVGLIVCGLGILIDTWFLEGFRLINNITSNTDSFTLSTFVDCLVGIFASFSIKNTIIRSENANNILLFFLLIFMLIFESIIGGIVGGVVGLIIGWFIRVNMESIITKSTTTNDDRELIAEIVLATIGVIIAIIIAVTIGQILRGIIGLIIGVFFGGIVGLIIGRMMGVFLGEIIGLIIEISGLIIGRIIWVMIKILNFLFISTLLLYFFLSTLYFVHYSLIIFFSLGWIQILLLWLTTLGIGGTVYWRGKTLDYEARNPLKGILDNTINN